MLGLKPIKLLPARERVASALRKAIISKSIPEGAELTLENTAQELGVSVTPVREAFQILARDGLLEVKQNRCASWVEAGNSLEEKTAILWQRKSAYVILQDESISDSVTKTGNFQMQEASFHRN